jgi:hypothetical protein
MARWRIDQSLFHDDASRSVVGSTRMACLRAVPQALDWVGTLASRQSLRLSPQVVHARGRPAVLSADLPLNGLVHSL